MNLPNPVTIQPPTITRSNGEVRVQKPIEGTIEIIYDKGINGSSILGIL